MSIEEKILNFSRAIAVIGLSPKSKQPSSRVGSCLKEHGCKVIPANPTAREKMGELSYPGLSSIP